MSKARVDMVQVLGAVRRDVPILAALETGTALSKSVSFLVR